MSFIFNLVRNLRIRTLSKFMLGFILTSIINTEKDERSRKKILTQPNCSLEFFLCSSHREKLIIGYKLFIEIFVGKWKNDVVVLLDSLEATLGHLTACTHSFFSF